MAINPIVTTNLQILRDYIDPPDGMALPAHAQESARSAVDGLADALGIMHRKATAQRERAEKAEAEVERLRALLREHMAEDIAETMPPQGER